MRFLVVDDDPDTQLLLRANVTRWGHECRAVGSAAEARGLCATDRPDVLLLDMAIPDTDGPALLRDLREAGIAPPTVVLVSALAPDALAQAADDLHVGWLAKPFTADEFRQRLGRLLPQ